MPKGVQRQWPGDEQLLELARRHNGTIEHMAAALSSDEDRITGATLRHRLKKQGILDEVLACRALVAVTAADAPQELAQVIHGLIKRKRAIEVEAIADELDCAPKLVREALARLRQDGFRVPDERTRDAVTLAQVEPDKVNLHKSLLEGHELRIGLVSDTHLCSNEQGLEQLELAYDTFAEEGITEVLHAGDWCSGIGIFKGQTAEIFKHTYEAQVDYLASHYPYREGIVTRGISGNHDIEGDFGRIGANPVVALANRRSDIEFLGDYSAWVQLPGGAWIHLLHGKGGMSYSYSYKAQKLVDGYPEDRKPSILAVGHWHVSGHIETRGIQVIWPGCFEWRSKFLERLGLHPSVGFQILNVTVGDDGELVRFTREWMRFREGRVVARAA